MIQADAKDKRASSDDAWQQNEIFDFIKQTYLLSARFVQDVVQAGRRAGAEDRAERSISIRASSSMR